MTDSGIIKIKGVVTRAVQYKENDKILTVLTAEQGLISVYCHGARSNKSKYLTSTRLFCYSEFVLTKKRDFYYVKEADYIEAFFDIVNDMDKLFLGQYFLEVANEVCVEGDRQDGMLRLLLNSLYAISAGLYPLWKKKCVFEMRTCVEAGVGPDLSGCRKCGNEKAEMYYFDVVSGEVTCRECLLSAAGNGMNEDIEHSSGSYLAVTPSVAVAVRYIESARLERVFAFTLSGESAEGLSALCEKFLLNQVGKSFVTLDMYNGQIK